jgi:hypothetical protein
MILLAGGQGKNGTLSMVIKAFKDSDGPKGREEDNTKRKDLKE